MFSKNKIDYATIKNILDELKRVGHIDFDETIHGQWTFEKVPIIPIIPFEGCVEKARKEFELRRFKSMKALQLAGTEW